jgi:uncharacterized protein YoxC
LSKIKAFFVAKKALLINIAIAVSSAVFVASFVLLSVFVSTEVKRNDLLEQAMSDIQRTLDGLKDDVGGLKDDVATGNSDLTDTLLSKINDLKRDITGLIDGLKDEELDGLSEALTELDDRLDDLESALTDRLDDLESQIVFEGEGNEEIPLNTYLKGLSEQLSTLKTTLGTLKDTDIPALESALQDFIVSSLNSQSDTLQDYVDGKFQDVVDADREAVESVLAQGWIQKAVENAVLEFYQGFYPSATDEDLAKDINYDYGNWFDAGEESEYFIIDLVGAKNLGELTLNLFRVIDLGDESLTKFMKKEIFGTAGGETGLIQENWLAEIDEAFASYKGNGEYYAKEVENNYGELAAFVKNASYNDITYAQFKDKLDELGTIDTIAVQQADTKDLIDGKIKEYYDGIDDDGNDGDDDITFIGYTYETWFADIVAADGAGDYDAFIAARANALDEDGALLPEVEDKVYLAAADYWWSWIRAEYDALTATRAYDQVALDAALQELGELIYGQTALDEKWDGTTKTTGTEADSEAKSKLAALEFNSEYTKNAVARLITDYYNTINNAKYDSADINNIAFIGYRMNEAGFEEGYGKWFDGITGFDNGNGDGVAYYVDLYDAANGGREAYEEAFAKVYDPENSGIADGFKEFIFGLTKESLADKLTIETDKIKAIDFTGMPLFDSTEIDALYDELIDWLDTQTYDNLGAITESDETTVARLGEAFYDRCMQAVNYDLKMDEAAYEELKELIAGLVESYYDTKDNTLDSYDDSVGDYLFKENWNGPKTDIGDKTDRDAWFAAWFGDDEWSMELYKTVYDEDNKPVRWERAETRTEKPFAAIDGENVSNMDRIEAINTVLNGSGLLTDEAGAYVLDLLKYRWTHAFEELIDEFVNHEYTYTFVYNGFGTAEYGEYFREDIAGLIGSIRDYLSELDGTADGDTVMQTIDAMFYAVDKIDVAQENAVKDVNDRTREIFKTVITDNADYDYETNYNFSWFYEELLKKTTRADFDAEFKRIYEDDLAKEVKAGEAPIGELQKAILQAIYDNWVATTERYLTDPSYGKVPSADWWIDAPDFARELDERLYGVYRKVFTFEIDDVDSYKEATRLLGELLDGTINVKTIADYFAEAETRITGAVKTFYDTIDDDDPDANDNDVDYIGYNYDEWYGAASGAKYFDGGSGVESAASYAEYKALVESLLEDIGAETDELTHKAKTEVYAATVEEWVYWVGKKYDEVQAADIYYIADLDDLKAEIEELFRSKTYDSGYTGTEANDEANAIWTAFEPYTESYVKGYVQAYIDGNYPSEAYYDNDVKYAREGVWAILKSDGIRAKEIIAAADEARRILETRSKSNVENSQLDRLPDAATCFNTDYQKAVASIASIAQSAKSYDAALGATDAVIKALITKADVGARIEALYADALAVTPETADALKQAAYEAVEKERTAFDALSAVEQVFLGAALNLTDAADAAARSADAAYITDIEGLIVALRASGSTKPIKDEIIYRFALRAAEASKAESESSLIQASITALYNAAVGELTGT